MADEPSPDFAALIPERSRWNDGAGIDVESWLESRGDFALALAFTTLFWPRFTEFDGCVLFAEFNLQSFSGFMEHVRGDRRAVEAVMNHRHLVDLFTNGIATASPEQLEYLGLVLTDIWRTKLARDFPNRKFDVHFDRGTPANLLDYIITFHQAE